MTDISGMIFFKAGFGVLGMCLLAGAGFLWWHHGLEILLSEAARFCF